METGLGVTLAQPGKESPVEAHRIRAAVLRKKGGPLEIESIEMEGPRDDEALVRIVASGICHTDIDCCDDWDETDTPVSGTVHYVMLGTFAIMPLLVVRR